MTANNTPATDAGDKYRDVTGEFARRLPKAWNELNRKNWQLVRNAEVAAIFRGGDRREEGEALLTCGTHRQGDSIKDLLKYTHYCRKPYSCVRCGTILAQYRAEQLMEASELFSVESKRSSLLFHGFTLMPDTWRIPYEGTEAFQIQTKLLVRFMDRLRDYHKEHGVLWFKKGEQTKKKLDEKRKRLLGPTVGSIHLVPAVEDENGYAQAHAHLGIVTTCEGRRKELKAQVEHLFAMAKEDLGLEYEPSESEIRPISKKKLYPDPSSIPEELKKVRWGSFDPSFIHSESAQQLVALRAFHYMSRPFKAKWGSEGVAETRQMLDMMGMEPRQLHRRFGTKGTTCKRLPETPPTVNDPALTADFDPQKGWMIRKPFGRDDS